MARTQRNLNLAIAAANLIPIWTDFIISTNTSGNPPWFGTAVSAGTVSAQNGIANHIGWHKLLSHATNADSGYRWQTNVSAFLIAGGTRTECVFQFIVPAAGTNTVYIGFADNTTATTPTDAIVIYINGTTLSGKTYNNSVSSETASNYTLVDGTWYRSVIEANSDATIITFTLYSEAGAVLWTDTLTTNIPTGAGRVVANEVFGWNSAPGGVAQEIIGLDFISITINRLLTR